MQEAELPIAPIPIPSPLSAPAPEQEEAEFKVELNELEEVPGITQGIADSLRQMGITSVEQLYSVDIDVLMSIKGMGEKRASLVVEALKAYK